VWFGLFEWPHIPGLDGKGPLADIAVEMHELLAWSLIALLVVHVAAALKHHFADRDDVLWSMLPFISRPSRME
jgi:cytochrome b561